MSAHLCPKCGENTIYFDGICHSCSQRQRREEILNLSADEVEAMILKIADRIDEIEKWDEICNDFWALFSLLGIHDPRIARAAAAKEIYYPPELYFGAPDDVKGALITKLNSLEDNSKNVLNHLLCALAWQGGEQTAELFYELYKNPRPWRKKLYVGTEFYAKIGGWAFDETGERKSLVFDKCLTAVRVKDGKRESQDANLNSNQSADEPVQIGEPTGQKCEFCGCEMLDMLRLKATDPQLAFLNLKHDAIFRCCPTCVGSVRYFCKRGPDSKIELSHDGEGFDESYFSQEDFARLCGMKFKLGGEVSLFYGCFSELDVTVGGYPQWVQDAEYLTCPSCGGTMKHLAQIPFGEMIEGEGVIYVQICEKCEILGGCFQCT
ncbi:cytochrome C [uncultured Campylobacter sp.]|uniref:cytochrome C n=1 Tax=uncultured Campylobacter sp. TaxID=218934 RepID=UPI0026242D54|nr:cytochrome C [uncultured Campylobacter sp.]